MIELEALNISDICFENWTKSILLIKHYFEDNFVMSSRDWVGGVSCSKSIPSPDNLEHAFSGYRGRACTVSEAKSCSSGLLHMY